MSLSFTTLLRPFSKVPPVRSTVSSTSLEIIGSMPSTMPTSRLPKYSPLCCLYSSRKVFCTATLSVGRDFEQAIAYFSVSASSLSRGTTLLTKPHSYISFALNGLPVNSISENLRSPIVSAGVVEVPPVAVALGLDDADLPKLLQRSVSGAGLGVEVGDGGQVAVGATGRVLDVVIIDRELVMQRQARVLQHRTLLGQVTATTEILALAADHDDLDVVVHVALVDQVGVVLPHAQRGRVELLRTVEGDVRDPVRLILLELDVLLGFLLQLFVVVFGHGLLHFVVPDLMSLLYLNKLYLSNAPASTGSETPVM